MYKLVILEPALKDLDEAITWYNEQNVKLSKQFFKDIEHHMEIIVKTPYLFPVQFSEIFRFAVLKKFPYRIVYKIDEVDKIIYINSIFHTKRNPTKFQ